MDPITFRNTFAITPAPFRLTERSRVVALGSCFADTMGGRLKSSKVVASVNPFGVLFQPLAITSLVQKALSGEPADARLFWERDGVWVSHEAHSVVRGRTRAELAECFGASLAALREDLARADAVLLTLGTAWAHYLSEPRVAVANNHKRPAACFTRQLLEVGEVRDALVTVVDRVRVHARGVRFVVTVSPVRHGRSGMMDNAVSKAVLRLACHQLLEARPDVYYFPAFELLMDDLRDYRFYGPDGLHPSDAAAAYIHEAFLKSCFTPEARAVFLEWDEIKLALAHRAHQPDGGAHRAFLEKLLARLEAVSGRLDVGPELESVRLALEDGRGILST